jgi:hypothetical protein
MTTALEVGPEGWKPYLEGLRNRPEPDFSHEQIGERERLIEKVREAAVTLILQRRVCAARIYTVRARVLSA